MKSKVIAITITLLVATAGALTLIQCDHSNMARVTIHIQNDLYAQKSKTIFDKILNLFSTKLYAWSPNHSEGFGLLTLTISGTGFESIQKTFSPALTAYTTEVPASTNVNCKLTFYNNEVSYNTFGGQTVVDLEPGDNDVSILMLPITRIVEFFPEGNDIEVTWEDVFETPISGYNIYRSSDNGDSYKKIGFSDITTYLDLNLNGGVTYYYKISVVSSTGKEGLLSQPDFVFVPE